MIKTISDIPVLFFPFSRPQYARQVFDAIKKAQPKKFYFYCDKAREGNEEEKKNNEIIRAYVNEVDWDCDLKTWFRDENIGVYQSILDAIDWFFDNEEFGIILEEDTLPSLAFFDFCRQLLPKYKDDFRVWYIGGNNFLPEYKSNYDYIFTYFAYQWGWATWKSRWSKLNRNGFDVKLIIEYDLYRQLYGIRGAANLAYRFLKKRQNVNGVYKPISWDYMFNMTVRINGGFGIAPKINLVSNIGIWGTNSKKINKIFHNKPIPPQKIYEIKNNPPFVVPDFKYGELFYKKVLRKNYSLINRLLKKINLC